MRIDPRLPLAAALLLVALAAAGCAEKVSTRGSLPAADVVDNLKVGVQTKDQVVQLLGSPSNVGTFDDNTWYYIGAKVEQTAFFKPSTLEQQVLQIKFDDLGVVKDVKKLGLDDAQQVALNSNETPTAGKELGFFEQLFGNVGRFNGGGKNGIGGGLRTPGSPQGGI
jgi:outer membrane protein assembly factor BamE (lipoprotein component of BamABCDE complex)